MFTICRQNRSHLAAHVGQALLYSGQPTPDVCAITFQIIGWRRFSTFVVLGSATAIQNLKRL